ncbi:MAG: SusD/RagB family nutrient-binding outer membrane lipoprotein [Muribaculaceae bacterium]|nr:SusD/RagB family nutrient-binding outer membrane lipoprotein [Muribaculaceae bacterium]
MKRNISYTIYLLATLIAAVGFTGCTESIMDDINKNTSNPPVSSVDARFQLTNAIMSMAFTTYGGLYSWTVASYTEQIFGDGGAQMMYAEMRDPIVTAAPTTFNNEWNNTYHNLLNISQIIDKCENGVNKGQEDLLGMARVLKVLGFQALTELHGDIPFSEALNDGIKNPKLDSQEKIYQSLLAEIDKAIESLNKAISGSQSSCGAQDILYGGNVKKWLGLAYAVKARLLLDGSVRFPTNIQNALASAEAAISEGFSGAELSIFNGVDADNSWAAFFRSRHYSGSSETVVKLMEVRNDPRLAIYATDYFDSGILYAAPGSSLASTIDNVGAPAWVSNEAATIHLLSEASLRFIMAECKARLGMDATEDFKQGVRSSLRDYSNSARIAIEDSDVDSYVLSFDKPDLKEIMVQKYLSQSRDEQIETYNDLRRCMANGEEYIHLTNPNNKDGGDNGENRWPYSLPYGNSDVVSNPNVAAAFGTGNSAGYYIFKQPLWLFTK